MKPFKGSVTFAVIALLFCGRGNAQNPSQETHREKTTAAGQAAWGDLGNGAFKNPFLLADYNNLDVIRVDRDFYMISASHHFMGMPVLHSKDMINWTLIARISRTLKIHERYDTPGQAYQHGTWAPAIRFHEGKFYVYVCTPQEGLLLSTATNPAGPWSPWQLLRKEKNWEDPCPFWDDVRGAGGDGPDGRQAYLIRSRLGAGPLIVHKMSWDGMTVAGDGKIVAKGPVLCVFKVSGTELVAWVASPAFGKFPSGPRIRTVIRLFRKDPLSTTRALDHVQNATCLFAFVGRPMAMLFVECFPHHEN